jgi:hypothetical protein
MFNAAVDETAVRRMNDVASTLASRQGNVPSKVKISEARQFGEEPERVPANPFIVLGRPSWADSGW